MLPEMERSYVALLERRAADRARPAYSARNVAEVTAALRAFFADERPGRTLGDVRRMGGGASKEQFFFTLESGDGAAEQYVLRMDPLAGINETDRRREFEVLAAMQGVVPAPRPVWLDPDGSRFGQAALIMEYVPGVSKPSGGAHRVSGLGTALDARLRGLLKPQFLAHLVAIHALDWRRADLPSFDAPTADPHQAARWSVNYWKAMWAIAKLEERPIFSLATRWLEENPPACHELVVTHGDYRTGNYLFDEAEGRMTAILDWELARIGDHHEDLAWVLMQLFGIFEGETFRASDLYEREEFIAAYEAAAGRAVDRATLHYYDVMASWKCFIIIASGLQVARDQHNHQDVLLSFLGAAGGVRRRSVPDAGAGRNGMIPSVDERLASIVRSLTDVVLPALPPGAGLAQEQVQLAIGHLQLLRAQSDTTPAFEADELADAVALAGALAAIDRAPMAGPLRAAAAAAEGAATPAAVREARIAVNAAIHAAIAAAPAKGTVRDALERCVIGAETVRSAKDRRWFAPFGFDPAPPGT